MLTANRSRTPQKTRPTLTNLLNAVNRTPKRWSSTFIAEIPGPPRPSTPPFDPELPFSSIPEHQRCKEGRRGKEVDYRTRCRIWSLREDSKWEFRRIAAQLHIVESTVRYIYEHRTPKKRSGWPKILQSPEKVALKEVATKDCYHRRMPYPRVAQLANIKASGKSLRQAFDEMGYHRRVARQKPFWNQNAKDRRLAWARAHELWTVHDWRRVIWTDESNFNMTGAHGKVWITRLPEEEFIEPCLIPKFEKKEFCMVWGAISGRGKLQLVFWDKKNWGNINAPAYQQRIVQPVLYPLWQREYMGTGYLVSVMEDKAGAHKAKTTAAMRVELGIPSLDWPSNSPDLNPIEGLWHKMKNFISQMLERPRTNENMQNALVEAWNAIPDEEVEEMIDSMPERVQAVIQANGGHTRW